MLGTLETFIFSLVAVPQQGKARIKVSYDGDTYIIDLEAQTIDCLKKEMSRKLDLDIGQVLIKIEFDGELCILESDSMLAETIALSSSTNKLAKVFAFQKPQKTLASSPVQGGGEPKPEVSFRTTVAVTSTAVLNPNTVTDLFQENEFDVMLSYQWDSQAKVLLIKEALKTRYNLKVWMDIDKMRDNIFRSMAEAVDKSKVVAAFVNSKYQNSPNCLSELSYARDRKKKIAPARDFHGTEDAKGPVYIMIAGALYCNFTDKEPGTADFDSEIDNLYKNIQLYLDDMERLKKQQNEDSKQQSTAAVPKIAELEKSNLENWLKPVDFQDDVGSYANAYVKGTRLWAVEMVNEWLQNEEERVLWLNGGAGLGKSFIAWLVSQNLPATYQLGSAFYCRHNDAQKNNAESLVATLAHDLSVVLPELQAHLEIVRLADEKRVADGNVSILSNPRKAFKSLLLDGFKSIQNPPQRNILIIIDALDECGKQGDATRAALLDWITKDAAQFPAYIKLFVTARPEIDIFEALQSLKSSCLVPSDDLNQADIRTFVVDRFTCDFNPQDKQDVESVSESAKKLAEKADGVFIYASLACEELKQRIFTLAEANEGQINLSVLPEFVEEYQGGIDQVYTKALVRAFEQADATSITMFQKVMGVIVAAREPLAQDTIASLLDIKTFAVGSLIMQIRPILKIDEMGLISVLHKSLTDILTSPTRCEDPRFLINLGQVHSDITVRSFDLIQELNSTTPSSSHIYACSFWADHLSKTNQHDSRALLTALERFVQDSIVDWVFALAVAQKLNATLSPSLESAMQFLSARFSVDGGNEVVPRLIHALMDFCAVDGLEETVLSEAWRAAVKRIHEPYAAIGEVDFEIKDEVDSSKTDECEEDEEEALEGTGESLELKRTEDLALHLPAPAPSKKKRQQPVVKEDDIVQSVEDFDSNIPDESCMPLNYIESKSEGTVELYIFGILIHE
ncbi:hypothetical protein BDR26DRAFT_690469 [Obelidium mucronatum]|nr:hypothetical protein BDR26DRAFT_690469 [Obelidium mucronatum]